MRISKRLKYEMDLAISFEMNSNEISLTSEINKPEIACFTAATSKLNGLNIEIDIFSKK